jgi:glycine hydroxymethyltransferase
VRIGTPSVTTQGMKEAEMSTIADFIAEALRGRQDADMLADVRKRVSEFCAKFPAY